MTWLPIIASSEFFNFTIGNVVTWATLIVVSIWSAGKFVSRLEANEKASLERFKLSEKNSTDRFSQNARSIETLNSTLIATAAALTKVEAEGGAGTVRMVTSLQQQLIAHETRLTNHDSQMRQLDVVVNDIGWIRHAIQNRWNLKNGDDEK